MQNKDRSSSSLPLGAVVNVSALTTWPVGEPKHPAPPHWPLLPACSKRLSAQAGIGGLDPAVELEEAQADCLALSLAGREETIALGTNQ